MKTLIQKTGYVRSTGSKAVIALIFTSAISGLSISSAHADDDWGDRGEHHGHHEWRGDRDYRPRYQQPYNYAQPVYVAPPEYYAQPVYVPPPVYYAPQQSPGISLFLPLHL